MAKPSYSNSFSSPQKKSSGGGFFKKLIIGAVALVGGSSLYNRYGTIEEVNIEITSITPPNAKEEKAGLIYAGGELFRNEASSIFGKSEDLTTAIQSTFEKGKKYKVEVYGTTLPILSSVFGERNIISAEAITPAAKPAPAPVQAAPAQTQQVQTVAPAPVVEAPVTQTIDSVAIAAAINAKQVPASEQTAPAAAPAKKTATPLKNTP